MSDDCDVNVLSIVGGDDVDGVGDVVSIVIGVREDVIIESVRTRSALLVVDDRVMLMMLKTLNQVCWVQVRTSQSNKGIDMMY